MRKVVLNLAVSLDGYIAGLNGEYDWCFTDQDYGLKKFLSRIDSTLMGRKTFEVLLEQGTETFEELNNFVFSKTLNNTYSDKVTIVKKDAAAFIKKLKQQQGKDLWLFGGSELIKNFLEENLIDELILSVHPVSLGDGIPLFQKLSERKKWQFVSCKSYSTGLVQLHYEQAQ